MGGRVVGREGGKEGGREGGRVGGWVGGRVGGWVGGREGKETEKERGKEVGRWVGRQAGRGGREGGREGGRGRAIPPARCRVTSRYPATLLPRCTGAAGSRRALPRAVGHRRRLLHRRRRRRRFGLACRARGAGPRAGPTPSRRIKFGGLQCCKPLALNPPACVFYAHGPGHARVARGADEG